MPFKKVYKLSKETREKMSKAHIGMKKPWAKGNKLGMKISEITKQKMSLAKLGRIGKKASNWKGGITLLGQQIRNSFEYRQWRSDIYTRDNYTCQECGQIGRELNAHHIITFSIIFKNNQIKTLEQALNCEELWNINNGITLCKKCHKLIHKY